MVLWSQNSFRNTIRVSNSWDPDPDLLLAGTLSLNSINQTRSSSGFKLFAKVISRRQKWLLARKQLSYDIFQKIVKLILENRHNSFLKGSSVDLYYDNDMQHRPQELEVQSLYHLYSLQTKSSQCHYVMTL